MSRIREIYSDDPQNHHASGELAAYLALVHTCGIEAPLKGAQLPLPQLEVDIFSVWNAAANPDLLRVLKREADAVVCQALGTRFPNRAVEGAGVGHPASKPGQGNRLSEAGSEFRSENASPRRQ
jgi:hypothetical protein